MSRLPALLGLMLWLLPGGATAQTVTVMTGVAAGEDAAESEPVVRALPEDLAASARESRQRALLVLNSTGLGLALMAGVLATADVKDPRLFAPCLLVGGVGALAASLLVAQRWSVSGGDNALVAAGGWYGAASGVALAGVLGWSELRWLMAGSLVGEVVGLGASILAAGLTDISPGDGAVIHSGAWWGLFTGSVLSVLLWQGDSRMSFGMILGGVQAGLAGGILSSLLVEVSPGRALVVDLFGLLGALLGASVGVPFLVEDPRPGLFRAFAGVLLGAAAAGMGLGAWITRRWDAAGQRPAGMARARTRTRRQTPEVTWEAPSPTIIAPTSGAAGGAGAWGMRLMGGTW